MAENKNAVLMYADWKDTFNGLSDANAGKLAKLIWAYINDEDPKPQNQVVAAAFIQIKNTLKRDLKKWEDIKKKRSEAGKASAEKKKQEAAKPTSVESVEQTPTDPTVSVIDSVSVNVSVFHIDLLDLKFENLRRDKIVRRAYDKYHYTDDRFKKLIDDYYQNCLEKQYTEDYPELVSYLSNFHRYWKDNKPQPTQNYAKI
jgi:hypothetical protein